MLAVAAFCLAPLLQQLEFLGSPGLIYIEHNLGAKVLFEGTFGLFRKFWNFLYIINSWTTS
jgi:hypothetical protein